MSHQVFISYSSWDKRVANIVCQELENHGVKCWIAPRDILPGTSWALSISNAIKESIVFVVILSERSITSPEIIREIQMACEMNTHVIPFLIDDIQLSGAIKYYLSTHHFLDATKQSLNESIRILSKNILITLQQYEIFQQVEEGSQDTSPTALSPQQIQSNKNLINAVNYDVFISYRRSTDSQTARLIRSELQNRGHKVFLDVDDLKPGHFDEALISLITETNNFVLILSKGTLDRCSNVDDWLRKEILCAIANKKNIIPIMMPGFIYPKPDEISHELKPLLIHHSINYSHDFFNAMVDKLNSFLE